MGYGSRAFLAGGLGFAVSFVVACGGGNGLLSGNQAADLNNKLNAVSSAVASRQCGGAKAAARSFSDSVTHLPSTVNTTLAQNLAQGASTVSQLAAVDCQSSSSTSTSTTPTTTSSTSSSSTSSTTATSTTTTPTSSTATSTSTSSSATTPSTSSTTSTGPTGGTGVGTNGNGTGNGGNGQ